MALVVAVALAASASGLGNGFALDDVPIVQRHEVVHSLSRWWEIFGSPYWPPERGGGLYRPLPMLVWAAQWTLGGGSPWPFHAVNVVLYAVLAAVVLRLMRALVADERAALVGAALFAAHPVHVEAVANVVALTELMAAVPMVFAVAWFVERRRAGALGGRDVVVLCGCYAAASLSKENGTMLPLLLVAAEVVLMRGTGPWRERARRSLPLMAGLMAVAAGYLVLRAHALHAVKGEYPHVVWAVVPTLTRELTMLGVAMEWLRLLFWPARLSAEYTPPHIRLIDHWSWALLPAAILVYGVKSFMVVAFRRAPLVAFASAWIVVTLFPVSNTFVVAGLILAERTLLLPSVAAMLAVAWLAQVALEWEAPRAAVLRGAGAATVMALVALGTWRSAERGPVWRDNETLFRQTVADAPQSYRARYNLGAWFMERGALADGERELRAAVALFPHDYEPMAFLANEYRKRDLCGPAVALYRDAIRLAPRAAEVRAGFVACLIAVRDFDSARALARRGLGHGWGGEGELARLMGVADSLELARTAPQASGAPVRGEPPDRHLTGTSCTPCR